MSTEHKTALKIAVCGSASVGKTTLVETLALSLGLPVIREEMREYIEGSGQRLSHDKPNESRQVLLRLWRQRQAAESAHPGFIADNCSLDFVAYTLQYGCLTEQNAAELLDATARAARDYDLIVVLGWGAIPYVRDGIRSDDAYEQFSISTSDRRSTAAAR